MWNSASLKLKTWNVTKNITEMKNHMKENHEKCGLSTIIHINDDNEATYKL